MRDTNIDGGIVREGRMDGYREEIESKDILSFSYQHPNFRVSCTKEGNKIHVLSSGGKSYERDGSHFKLEYDVEDKEFLQELQRIIEEYHLSKNNGYVEEVAGLPSGLGDTLSVEYETGEKIYLSSNRGLNLSNDAILEVYEAFHALALQNHYDFTTEKSNQVIYDDATEEFLQGSWKGTHFGDEILVTFTKNIIQIFVNGEETDHEEYKIVEGTIQKNSQENENFKGVSYLKKKNKILLVAYFVEDSYSTCDLLIQK